MQRAVNAALFVDAVKIFGARIFPAGLEFLQRKFVRSVTVNLIGAEKDENGVWAMEMRGFQEIDGAKSVDFKIEDGDVAGLVMGRLGGAVDDQVKAMGTKERLKGDAVADVHIVMSEVFRNATQPV